MLNIAHKELFDEVVTRAKRSATGDARWANAINRAVTEIENNVFMHWQGSSMLIQSSTSDEVYVSNGDCQCKAFTLHRACWHRASARIWLRYSQALNESEWPMKRAA